MSLRAVWVVFWVLVAGSFFCASSAYAQSAQAEACIAKGDQNCIAKMKEDCLASTGGCPKDLLAQLNTAWYRAYANFCTNKTDGSNRSCMDTLISYCSERTNECLIGEELDRDWYMASAQGCINAADKGCMDNLIAECKAHATDTEHPCEETTLAKLDEAWYLAGAKECSATRDKVCIDGLIKYCDEHPSSCPSTLKTQLQNNWNAPVVHLDDLAITTVDDAGNPVTIYPCKNDSSGNPIPGISAKIVNCVKVVTQEATVKFVTRLNEFMKPIAIAAMMLAVALFGAQMALGAIPGESLGRYSFILVFKIALILFFLSDTTMIRPLFNTITAVEDMVAKPFALGKRSIACAKDAVIGKAIQPTDPNAAPLVPRGYGDGTNTSANTWKCMDTLIARTFGFGTGVTLAMGVMAIITAALFSGSLAIWLFFFALSGVFMLFLGMLRAVHITLMAFLGLGLLIAIMPIMLPMMLFRATQPLFDKWLEMLIPMMFQPVIVIAFLSLAVLTLDQVILESPSRPGDATLGGFIDSQLQDGDYVKSRPQFSQNFNLDVPSELSDALGVDIPKGDFNFGSLFTFPRLSFKPICIDAGSAGSGPIVKCRDGTVPGIKKLIRLMCGILFISYLMFTVFGYIPQVAGGLAQSAVNLGKIAMPFESNIQGALQGAQVAGMQTVAGSKSLLFGKKKDENAAEKLMDRGVPAMLTGGIKGFISPGSVDPNQFNKLKKKKEEDE